MGVINDIDLIPITRLEYDIDAIINDHSVIDPVTRIEQMLSDIKDGTPTAVEPVTRIETFLANISGVDIALPEPVTRIETFLAIIAGGDYEAPEPATRLEGLLAEWVEKGSGIWKTVIGTLLHITDALASPVKELSVAIELLTGKTGCNIWLTGKNLFDKTNISENNRYIKSDGSLVSNSSWVVSSYIHVKAGETYTLSNYQNSNTSAPGVRYYGNDGGIVGFSYGSTRTKTFTVPDGALTMRISVMASLIDSCQLELGSTATTHEDYQGTTTSISWQTEAGSITSGTLTISENGSVTLESGGNTYNLTSITPIETLAGENNIWADVNGEITLINKAQAE